ncbi:Na+/H+ antiporter family protein [Rossellomorea marisflavi]|uniref:Na+/H+ antiporter family protein n=1 Tax=Rossellomorea marisflavi TaxID=189381 RepID=A0A5D4RTM1_9BACI|nr:Na+/H+ antiporter family protein [Rossellomorea marisflavi]KQU57943.1 sodium:proton antiporter [Bacillus sp. Leaf406]MDW4527865.1 Na+/H+ antiporter family protein [Rossellomorea marisflavi]TYS52932.1 Na+/H+ antiporter family protein [Rossellomorea marisflavi]UKS64493.1 Na+/H+ antiporter family protein [Rossellomorea marisflavi]WJV19874.1 Na+/H+ antiporter family protein [Rossellomorea marisflavi]
MNAVVIAVLIMLILSLLRVNVVFALIAGALAGGVIGGLGLNETVSIFSDGISGGANIALSYALLGGFAVAISYTGIPNLLVDFVLKMVGRNGDSKKKKLSKALIVFAILIMACFSQNVIPIHIAFIPILIPPLLKVMTELEIDRRLIATVITFGLTAPYILLPVGFGLQFHEVIAQNMDRSGMAISMGDIPKAMLLPVGGMVLGLLIAVFFSYRKPRQYDESKEVVVEEKVEYSKRAMILAGISIIAALAVQLLLESMIFGALAGIAVLYVSGAVKWKEADGLLNDGMKMMAFIGFVMIAASGFAAVLTETGDVESLVKGTADAIGGNKALAALLMLLVGLIVTMGIGSSFATIPIIAAIFVPLCMELGFSEFATIIIVGTAGALGDAGSPASDSTLGPTAGLNADGQHNHIWDTCVPTFLHYNIPLVAFGWIAAMIF